MACEGNRVIPESDNSNRCPLKTLEHVKGDGMKKIDIIGQKFGRWTVVKETGRDERQECLWECRCDCGNIRIVQGHHLRSGHSKSCGCLKREKIIERNITHGMCKTTTYKSWSDMLQRCNNTKNSRYPDWGGRGIKVCEEWLKFENFLKDMGEKPKGFTLERQNNEDGYYKTNCCWISHTEQNRNQRIKQQNKTGISGISWYKSSQRYVVHIAVNYKQIHIGYFTDLEEAKIARKLAEIKYWGREYKYDKR